RRIAALVLMANREHQRNQTELTRHGVKSANAASRSNRPVLLRHGTAALQQAVEYSKATNEPEQVAERMLELADWYLLMHRYDEAYTAYGDAARFLSRSGVTEERRAILLGGGHPVHDPADEL